ncbi:hypothetical protein A0U40_09715 [[Bacillus] sp. KCTC 13219]|nr:hypothetical protein A0U40_09715 [[Bacillus] sp. KCTC 13219]
MKLYNLKFNTANITIEDLRGDYDNQPPNDKELEAYLKAFKAIDGVLFMGGSLTEKVVDSQCLVYKNKMMRE